MEVAFEKIHETVIAASGNKQEHSAILKVVGKWYYDFLKSSEKKLTLHVPKFELESLNIVYNYTRLFSLTFRLTQSNELTSFENTCLFNVFGYNKNRPHFSSSTKSTIDFIRQDGDILLWAENIAILKGRFLPVFTKGQIEYSQWEDTYNTFKLFKAIENNGLINYPILIDIKQDLCLSLSTSEEISVRDVIQFKTLNWDSKKYSQEDVISLEEELVSNDFTHQITIKYPYHKNIHSYLLDKGKKSLNLIFNSRFYYQNLTNDDLFLLPREIHEKKMLLRDFSSKFTLLDTNHSLELYKILSEFRLAWKDYEFNKFTTPFPKYWFLFINQNISKDEWFEMFKEAYPDVAERPIISSVKKIIDLIHDLNWSKLFIEEAKNPIILLPEIRGSKKKKIERALSSFKNYLLSNNSNTTFVENNEDYDYKQHNNLLVLEGFNIINLVNILQENEDVQIAIPDFLYFNYQPWIKYQLLNYQFDVLLNPKRETLDLNFSSNKVLFINLRAELIKNTKNEIIKYRKRYNIQEEVIVIEENQSESEDMVLRNEEELEISLSKSEKPHEIDLQIETTDNKIINLKSNNQVLLERSSIITCRASYLKPGDNFITMNEITSLIDEDAIINKLSRIPDSVIDFQQELGNDRYVFVKLTKLGLDYVDEKWFNKSYVLLTKGEFILPKKKANWKIICEYLGVNSIDMNQAWISHYGRKHINELKGIYKHILNLCVYGEYLSEIENPQLINTIANYLAEKAHIFEELEETNTVDLATSIISAIINELSFHEVKEIKTN